jgi:hypothetical protein
MSTIETFLEEIIKAEVFETIRIRGYTEMLSFSNDLLSEPARSEISEAIFWSNARHQLISTAIQAITELLNNGYPDRVQQIASSDVIDELIKDLQYITLAVAEFNAPPKAVITVGPEVLI